jgi:RimJ/RimL family protein N-acetyltransferase
MDTNALLLGIPDRIETERLVLRVPRAGDGKITASSVRESLAELKVWMPWAHDDYNETHGEEWCRKAAGEFLLRNQLQYIILLRPDETHLGSIGAFRFDWNVPKGEIGYWLRTSFRGRGLMSEAVNALCDLLLTTLKFQRVEIRTDHRNLRSQRVAERCGFALDGILRNECREKDGTLRNTRVYSRVPPA